jgi:ATP-binding cassette subfamily B protein
MITVSRKVIFTLRREIFDRLTGLPVKFFDTHATGDILSRVSYDCVTLNASLSTDLVQILASIVTVLGALVMMLQISPTLVLVFAVTVPLSVLVTRYIATHTQPLYRDRSRKLGALNGFVEEMITGQKTLKAYNQEAGTIAQLDAVNDAAVEAYYKTDFAAAVTGPTVMFINNLSLTLVSVFGALIHLAGGMSVGNISTFVLYSRKFSGPINEVANIYGELQSSMAAAERIFRLLDEPLEPADSANAAPLHQVEGDVRFDHARFGYLPGVPVLKDLSLTAQPGSLTAIVGPTGAGKTTIIKLLMRFYDLDGGAITIDSTDTRDLTRDSLRRAWAMVLQDTWLFRGTIFENLAYGRPEATREEVIAAAKSVRLDGYISRLPQGYDTVLSDDAANISKGQMQLLTIARAGLMGSRMLILDEATSNVDSRTEVQIQQAMRALMRDKTCFVVAHRLSTIRGADQILVVRDGDVVESGTHAQLMAQGGFYRELYDAQFA